MEADKKVKIRKLVNGQLTLILSLKKHMVVLRTYDSDMVSFKSITDGLQANDAEEVLGSVTITDNLQRIETPNPTNYVQIEINYRVPEPERNFWGQYINNLFNW